MNPKVIVNWQGDMAFEATGPSGASFLMDAYPESGGANRGPTPVEALISSIAGCAGMDVISILKKKKQEVTSYRIEVEWTRGPEGEWPRPVTSAIAHHYLEGPNLEPVAVERAVQLSDEKYCTVMATLRNGTQLESQWHIAESAPL